ncbi:MAG: DUF1579 family protein [Actinomycetota bacterium]
MEKRRGREMLAAPVGEWDGTANSWFEPRGAWRRITVARNHSTSAGWPRHLARVQGSLGGEPLSGAAIYAHDPGKDKFHSAWVDTFHMGDGIMSSISSATERGLRSWGAMA